MPLAEAAFRAARRMSVLVHLRKRFQRAKDDGDLPKGADPAELALFVTVVVFGMGVLSVCGATRRELMKVVDTALRAWPTAAFATIIYLAERSLPHLHL